ncbi:DinB family protein [Solicola gregarius]|uniref:DinB family protein n=1 Tax=Solicola gregarius TaxID=2908642 RepID=A0AA46YLD9_9ACTN|nr:DinB family protein [Solicola gregarius]UYM06825.1 DinB family protein [Solicola gregarius]
MATPDPKDVLHRYLQTARDVMLWKLDGVSEYDVRRPLTPTGTNLLGLVKHLTGVEAGYLGVTFDRPFELLPWLTDDADDNVDMWATPDETREQVVGLYRQVWEHSDETIDTVDLDAPVVVRHWPPERRDVTLHLILVYVIAETHRHAGHADIVRELIDGAAGMRDGTSNLPGGDPTWWSDYREQVERAARIAGEP